ncbi:MAG: hypothetical protein HOK43_06285 [Chloroflexi bacterium]|nr:hypothetical protein [Chloroflexota bacterium]
MYTGLGVTGPSKSYENFIAEFVRIDAGGTIPYKRVQMTAVASELSTPVNDA